MRFIQPFFAATTLGRITLGIVTLRITALSITTFRRMTHSAAMLIIRNSV
jgi:hypothetical protein